MRRLSAAAGARLLHEACIAIPFVRAKGIIYAFLKVKGLTYPGSSIFDLALNALPICEELLLDWTYNTDLFESHTIEHWKGSLEVFLEGLVTSADQPLDQLPL